MAASGRRTKHDPFPRSPRFDNDVKRARKSTASIPRKGANSPSSPKSSALKNDADTHDKRSLQQRALKRITKYCSESVANTVPEWVVNMVVTLEKEQQTEIERRDESYENLKAQLENEREHHSKTKEQMQTTSDEAASERAAKEEALKEKKSLQEQLEAERSARQDAERASSAAVEECASMRDELHKLRTEKRRVEVIRAVRGYNTRRRLKDSRMGERELRQQCSKLSAQLDCSRASLRQLESAQKGKQQVVIAADKGTRPARSA